MIDNLKKNIKHLLLDKDISAPELERRAGLKSSSIRNILSGRSKSPSVNVIAAVAKELNCTLEDLMGDQLIFSRKSEQEQGVPLDISVVEKIFPILFDELKKSRSTVDKSMFMVLLAEIHDYAQKMPNKAVDRTFIGWLVERYLTQRSKYW